MSSSRSISSPDMLDFHQALQADINGQLSGPRSARSRPSSGNTDSTSAEELSRTSGDDPGRSTCPPPTRPGHRPRGEISGGSDGGGSDGGGRGRPGVLQLAIGPAMIRTRSPLANRSRPGTTEGPAPTTLPPVLDHVDEDSDSRRDLARGRRLRPPSGPCAGGPGLEAVHGPLGRARLARQSPRRRPGERPRAASARSSTRANRSTASRRGSSPTTRGPSRETGRSPRCSSSTAAAGRRSASGPSSGPTAGMSPWPWTSPATVPTAAPPRRRARTGRPRQVPRLRRRRGPPDVDLPRRRRRAPRARAPGRCARRSTATGSASPGSAGAAT